MGHAISAVLIRGEIDASVAERFGVRTLNLGHGLTVVPISPELVDEWSEREGVAGVAASEPILNFNVVHHVIAALAPGATYALIETDYFGGVGEQAAAVYCGGRTLMEPCRASMGPINEALRHLGVSADPGRDEFDTVGLGRFRSTDKLFSST